MYGAFIETSGWMDGWMPCDITSFLARLDEVQEELLYYSRRWRQRQR